MHAASAAAVWTHVYSAAMILITGGAGFIGSNLQAALARRGHETVVVDRLGSDGKWRNLANHPPARVVPPDGTGRVPGRPTRRWRSVFHLGAVSETTATDGDHTWATNVELSRRLWEWCADRERADGLCLLGRDLRRRGAGLRRRRLAGGAERLRPLNLYGWTKHAFDMLVARHAAARRASSRRNGPG